MKNLSFILTILALAFASMFSCSCTSKSEPEVLSDFIIHTEFNPVIIPYYMFKDEGLQLPAQASQYYILNSQQDVSALPGSEVFFYLKKEINNNFDFTDSSIILVSVLGEIEGPAPHCTVEYSYNEDKSATLVTVKWKDGLVPIEDLQNVETDKAALIQFAIGIAKISSDTPIIIDQIYS